MKRISNKMKGVTLLEVIIAMMIFSTVIVFIFMAFSFQTTSLAKNRRVIEDDNIGVKEIEQEIQNIKDYKSGKNTGYDIASLNQDDVTIFDGAYERTIDIFEIEKKIGDAGKKLNTFVADGSRLELVAPIIASLKATLKVNGTEVEYAYINEDFDIVTEIKLDPKTATSYLQSLYEWSVSKPGHNIFVNRDRTELTEHQRFGLPSTSVDYTVIPDSGNKQIKQNELGNLKGNPKTIGGYSKEFKGGYIDVSVVPISDHGKIGPTKRLDPPIYIVGLPVIDNLYAHMDTSITEFKNINSTNAEAAESELRNIARNSGLKIEKTNLSTGVPDININDISESTENRKYFKYLSFKGDSIYNIPQIMEAQDNYYSIFVVARPVDGKLDTPILSSGDFPGNSISGWTFDFNGFRDVYEDGVNQNREKTTLSINNEDINNNGWNVLSLEYQQHLNYMYHAHLRANGAVIEKKNFSSGSPKSGLRVGGYEYGVNYFLPSTVDIAEIIIYKEKDAGLTDLEKEYIEDYLFTKYGINPSPNRVVKHLPSDWE